MANTLHILLMLLAGSQAVLMFVDEGIFHRRRGLEAFERWGHVASVFAWGLYQHFYWNVYYVRSRH